jgi:RHS repeat-associated protein
MGILALLLSLSVGVTSAAPLTARDASALPTLSYALPAESVAPPIAAAPAAGPNVSGKYFGARYYGSKIGRFTTTDPVYDWKEDIAEPQRWNRYAYARNNPLRYVDPDGRRDGKTGLDMRQVQANADAIGKVLVNTVRAINSPGHMSAEKARAYYEQPDSPDQALRMDVADLLLTAWLGATLVKKGPEGPYDYIPDGPSVGPGKPFTQSQKAKIYEANRQRNGGVLRSDCSGCELAPSERSMKGVPTPPNAAQVDHNLARSRGGSNSFTNARVLSAQENQTKGAN